MKLASTTGKMAGRLLENHGWSERNVRPANKRNAINEKYMPPSMKHTRYFHWLGTIASDRTRHKMIVSATMMTTWIMTSSG